MPSHSTTKGPTTADWAHGPLHSALTLVFAQGKLPKEDVYEVGQSEA